MIRPRRRAVLPLALAACLVLAAACGGDDDADDADGPGTPTTEAPPPSTATDSGPDETPGETSDENSTSEVPPDDDVQVEAEDVGWTLSAVEYRERVGARVAFACPPDGEIGSVWGTDVYTDDSSVCSAAVHAGLITVDEGGRVVIEVVEGRDAYEGSEANGVASSAYATWPGSFTFPPV